MKKKSWLAITIGVMLLMAGCSKFSPDESGAAVDKNGKVTGVAVESLDKDYYNETELQSMIDQEIAEYAKTSGKDSVKLDKFSVKDKKAKLVMTYDTPKDYADFNHVSFYEGKLTEAEQAGYALKGSFQKVEKGKVIQSGVSPEEIMTKDYQVIVLEEPILLQVPGDIVYISSNMEIRAKNQAKFLNAAEKEEEAKPQSESGSGTEKGAQAQSETELLMISGQAVDEADVPGAADSQSDSGSSLAYIIYE